MLNTESLRKPAINYITKRTRKRSLPRGKSDTRRTRRGNYPKRKNILNSDCLLEERILREKKEKKVIKARRRTRKPLRRRKLREELRNQSPEHAEWRKLPKEEEKGPRSSVKTHRTWNHKTSTEIHKERAFGFVYTLPPRGGGGYSKKFYTGKLRPEVQPLTLLFTIFFFRKGTPFVYLLLEKGTPFIYLLMNIS